MAITTNCSGCGKTLAVADEFAGRQARCPACGQIYTVPASGSPPLTSNTTAPSSTGLSTRADASAGDNNAAPFDFGFPSSSDEAANVNAPATADPFSLPTLSPTSPNTPDNSTTSGVQYWMKAGNGTEYGPVDGETLARWFAEGRVGPDYQIRIGPYGHWQPAAPFQAIVTGMSNAPETGANPYAVPSSFTPGVAQSRVYPKSDQSGLVLAMGILSWIGSCPIFGIIAWVVGGQALTDINSGQADPSSRGVVQVGYYLGMINVILWIACGGFMLLGIILSAL